MKTLHAFVSLAAVICAVPALVLPAVRHGILVGEGPQKEPPRSGLAIGESMLTPCHRYPNFLCTESIDKFECQVHDHMNPREKTIERINFKAQEADLLDILYAEENKPEPEPANSHWVASSPKTPMVDEESKCPAEGEYCERDPKNLRKIWCCPGLRCVTTKYDEFPTCEPLESMFSSTTALGV
ncbi:hypothetical protein IFR05_008425 [Cadophora sp. M221]|nr:hypothetical protein IFR05_008425 [Cadophora sp. M221]